MVSLITVGPTSVVEATATLETNKENKGSYGRKHKLMHDGYYFNRKNDGKKEGQYNCINNHGKHPVCSTQIRILRIDGSIVEKGKHVNICAQKSRDGNPLKDVTNVEFIQEMVERVDDITIETLGIQLAAIWMKVSIEITAK